MDLTGEHGKPQRIIRHSLFWNAGFLPHPSLRPMAPTIALAPTHLCYCLPFLQFSSGLPPSSQYTKMLFVFIGIAWVSAVTITSYQHCPACMWLWLPAEGGLTPRLSWIGTSLRALPCRTHTQPQEESTISFIYLANTMILTKPVDL